MLKQALSLRANSGVGEVWVRRGSKASKGEKEKGSARGMPHATCYRLVCNAPLFGDGNSLWRVRGRGEVRSDGWHVTESVTPYCSETGRQTDGRVSQQGKQVHGKVRDACSSGVSVFAFF